MININQSYALDKSKYKENVSKILDLDNGEENITNNDTSLVQYQHKPYGAPIAKSHKIKKDIFDEAMKHKDPINITTNVFDKNGMYAPLKIDSKLHDILYEQQLKLEYDMEHLTKIPYESKATHKQMNPEEITFEKRNRPKLLQNSIINEDGVEDIDDYDEYSKILRDARGQKDLIEKLKHESHSDFGPVSQPEAAYSKYLMDMVQNAESVRKQFDVEIKGDDKEIKEAKKAEKRHELENMVKRRNDVESRLRSALSDYVSGTGNSYMPEDGFVVCSDQMLTMFEHLDNFYIRFSVYQKGQPKSIWYTTPPTISESYGPGVNRVFFGEQTTIRNVTGDREAYLIIELLNNVKQANITSTELIGWSVIQLFNDHDDMLQEKWCIPIFKPPTQFAALPYQLTNKIWLVEGSKLFIRICTPRNDRLNYFLKKETKIDDNYVSSDIYDLGRRQPKFYSEWLEQHNEKQFKADNLGKRLAEDLETIRKYLDDEQNWINEKRIFYVKRLEEELEKLRTHFQLLNDQVLSEEELKYTNLNKQIGDAKLGMVEDELYDMFDRFDGEKIGIKITFNKLLEVKSYKPQKIYAEVFLEHTRLFDEFGNPCMYNTLRADDHCPDNKKKPKTIEPVDVIFGDLHYCVKHLQGIVDYFKGKKELWVLFQVYELKGDPYFKSKKKYKPSYVYKEERTFLAWTVFKINRPNLLLKEGRYKEYLFKPPAKKPPMPDEKWEDCERLDDSSIDFTLEAFKYNNNNRDDFTYRRFKRRTKKVKQEGDEVDLRPFIPNDKIPYTDKQFDKGSGIDFYVDSARYLPNSCTVTKIVVRIVDSNLVDLKDAESEIGNLNSSVYAPVFNLRIELRFPFFNPNTMAIITVLTVDSTDPEYKPAIVGYVFFPLFIINQTDSKTEKSFSLRDGHYQVPIYSQEYYLKKPFQYEDQKFLDKLPCGTLLIRCRLAPKDGYRILSYVDIPSTEWEETGVWPPPPAYHKGLYYNSECDVNEAEVELFEILRFRPEVIVAEKAVKLAYDLDMPLDAEQDTNEIERSQCELINTHQKPTSRTDIIELKYMAKYNPRAGFKLCIDGLHNLPNDGFYSCLYCINPPRSLYQKDMDPLQVHVNSAFDWDSPKNSPKYSEGYVDFKDIAFDSTKHIVQDFREFKYVNKKKGKGKEVKIESYAWTIVPLFTYDGYINSGIYQIPLIKGKVQEGILKDILLNADPWKKFWELTTTIHDISKKPILLPLKYCSVIVRLLDGQREGHFQIPFDHRRMNRSYQPQNDIIDYTYNEVVEKDLEDTARLSSLVPSNQVPSEVNRRITNSFVGQFGLKQYQIEDL